MVPTDAPAPNAPPGPPAAGGSGDRTSAPTARGHRTPSPHPTILYVEDDKDYRDALALRLTRLGYTVVEAGDGADAMLRYLAGDVDLVLTDIFMPTMDGVELIRSLQALEPEIPIVAYSGAIDSDVSGVTTCGKRVPLLSKPVNLLELATTLKQALGE
ncbi:MAG TPA: response regulator [Planctomycetota bacterium]|nr:response regulator [Planctomycetota bacterium]